MDWTHLQWMWQMKMQACNDSTQLQQSGELCSNEVIVTSLQWSQYADLVNPVPTRWTDPSPTEVNNPSKARLTQLQSYEGNPVPTIIFSLLTIFNLVSCNLSITFGTFYTVLKIVNHHHVICEIAFMLCVLSYELKFGLLVAYRYFELWNSWVKVLEY